MPTSNPKISVNKLAEYMTSGFGRKRTIVSEQKYPDPFRTARYTEVKDAYVKYLIAGKDKSIVEAALTIVAAKITTSDFQQNNKDTSLQALGCCDEIPFPDLSSFTLQAYRSDDKLIISDVEVSVFPNIIFRGTYKGKKTVGGLKIHINKTKPLSEDARKIVATVVHQFLEEKVKQSDEEVNPDFVFSIDIFSKKCESAPKSVKRRRAEIQMACEEYALKWDKL